MPPARLIAVPLAVVIAFAACSGNPASPRTERTPAASTPARATPSPGLPPVSREPCGTGARTVGFRVKVSDRIDRTTKREFAHAARAIVCDERSWIASGDVRFRYDPNGSLLIGLRTPAEAEARCLALIRLSVNRFYSCGTPGEVVINSDRWFGNSPHWPGPLREYRKMLMNHEVGHALGLHHQQCARDGARAPVMMQQSKGMNLNGKTCRPNPWPLAEELGRV